MAIDLKDHIAFRPEKPLPALVAKEGSSRVMVFALEPGQEIPTHAAPATVFLLVHAGSGRILSGEESSEAGPGTLIAIPPDVPHGMAADKERFVVVAFIAFLQGGAPSDAAPDEH